MDRSFFSQHRFGIMYDLFQLFTEVFRPYQRLLIAGLVNEGFEFMTALGVFGVLDFLAAQQESVWTKWWMRGLCLLCYRLKFPY